MTLQSLITFGPEEISPDPTMKNPVGTKRILHIGIHGSANRNAGDTLLFPVVRKTFDALLGDHEWELHQAWTPFTIDDALRSNRDFDGIVIGGGGLLLRDQAGSDVSSSGWQWNSTVEAVRAIDIPLIVFAIGYNRFRGQDDFHPVFRDHISALAAKASFFGLRNTGSINALKQYLESDQSCNLRRQFCPTNILWQLYPEYRELAQAHDAKENRVLAFNAAFDRPNLRFGNDADNVLANVTRAIYKAQRRGWKVVLAAHKTMDRQIEPYLDASGIEYDTVDLTDAGPNRIMAFYAQVDLAFGMRGHAQMIPFGLRRPIMSIISHDKMRFLLNDIERPTWGVEVDSPDLADRLDAALSAVEADRPKVHADIALAQEAIWKETVSNMRIVGQELCNRNTV